MLWYCIGCKWILNFFIYYFVVVDLKIELIIDCIDWIMYDGIVIVDGIGCEVFWEVDVIVYVIGFYVIDFYIYVQIKGCYGEDLVDCWNCEGIGVYCGIIVVNMFNLFFLLGLNIGLGYNFVVFMIELQIYYVVDVIVKCDWMGV